MPVREGRLSEVPVREGRLTGVSVMAWRVRGAGQGREASRSGRYGRDGGWGSVMAGSLAEPLFQILPGPIILLFLLLSLLSDHHP